jgi:hypothetical protein
VLSSGCAQGVVQEQEKNTSKTKTIEDGVSKMSDAQLKGGILSARAALRRAVEESKIDMGLLDVPRMRTLNVLKSWDKLKSEPPDAEGEHEPFSFESFLRDTGT